MVDDRLDLCGLWRFQPDPGCEGDKTDYAEPAYDDRFWREVRVPSCFEACGPGLETYEGTGWYRRSLNVPDWQGRRVLLRFYGVNLHTKVWVNGHLVGEHEDGFLPFSFAVQDVVRCGEQNTIAVQVDNVRRPGEVPGLQRGWRPYGGILREVELMATDFMYMDQVTIVAEPASEGGTLAIRAGVENQHCRRAEAGVRVQIIDSSGATAADLASKRATLGAGEGRTFSLGGLIAQATPWSPSEPNLYTAEVSLWQDGECVETQMIRFGFRRIEARAGKLWLNGEPIYLTGFNRHEDSPRHDMATDLDTARRDLLDMKAAGANFVRLCHYPHHPGELDLCDEIGLLTMDEIPLYWWDGCQEGEEKSKQKLAAAKRQLTTLIRRDVNHPSAVFWSVSNETKEERPEVVDGNRQLVRLAQRLDPTRLAVHVSDHWRQDPHFQDDDVICVNGYPSLDRRGLGGDCGYDFAVSTAYWREHLRALHEVYPQKPILVSEFGYASFEGVTGGGFGEDVQAEAIAAEFAGMDAPYVCGATIWCWADHAWPPTTFGYCRYLGISPYGVVTRRRRKLKAYGSVRALFRAKQGIIEAARESGPRREGAAGYGVWMVRSHLEQIPEVDFPEGFGIRPMRRDDIGLWTDIERDAEEYFPISDEAFYHAFGSDLEAIQWRCFIITNPKGAGVGTISAWYDRNYKGQDYGRIHWVAVRRAYQGQGLGKAGLSFALKQLAQWHERCYLDTQTRRLPAIQLYLNFGFVPDMDVPGAAEGWRQVREAGLVF